MLLSILGEERRPWKSVGTLLLPGRWIASLTVKVTAWSNLHNSAKQIQRIRLLLDIDDMKISARFFREEGCGFLESLAPSAIVHSLAVTA
jgi:hypothetical protein